MTRKRNSFKLSTVEATELLAACNVLDIDFSKWYEGVDMLIFAGGEEPPAGRGRLLTVRFLQVSKISIEFPHHQFDQVPCVWATDSIRWIETDDGSQSLVLSGPRLCPRVGITFRTVEVHPESENRLSQYDPDWRKRAPQLIRPPASRR